MACSNLNWPSPLVSFSSLRCCPRLENGPLVRLLPRGLLCNSSPHACNLHHCSFSSSHLNSRRDRSSPSYLHDPTGKVFLRPACASAFAPLESYQPVIASSENFEPRSQSNENESVLFTFSDQKEVGLAEGAGGGTEPGGGGDGSGWNGGDGKPGNGGEGEGESEDKKMSVSQKLTLAYAALVGVGGAIGYVKKKSVKSLISGAVSSLLLCYVCTQLPVHPVYASSLGLGVSGVLVAVTGIRFKKTGKIFPALFLSLVSFIMAGGYTHGIMRASHA